MKIKTIVTVVLLFGVTLLLSSFGGGNSDYPSGAPSGYTGSPGDGQDCHDCHGGSATAVSGWITTNIPAGGYTAGSTYNITVSVSGSGSKGFQVSPQNAAGTQLGTMVAGSGSETTGSGKYVTHSSSSSSNPATWTFQWIAPASGTGSVTFYGAFCVTKSDTRLSTLTVTESATPSPYVFTDNFNRDLGISPLTNGGTPAMTWTTASTASPAGLSITNAATNDPNNYVVQMYAGSTPAAGRTYITGPLSTYSTPFSSTLSSNTGPVTWTFNMKTNRSTALSGFDAGNYGSAVILAMTSSNPTSATTNGYAVVLVKGTTLNAIKLVRFANGLILNSNLTTMIGPSPDLGSMTMYASVRVVYTPSSNTWELFVRSDGSTTDPVDPTTGTLTQVGTSVINSTYTSVAMSHCGFLWNHSNGAGSSNKGAYDNFSVAVTPILNPTLTAVPGSFTGFNYVVGSGPSASQSYSLSGVNLTGYPGNIAVGCLTNYEVSTDNVNFYPSVNVGYTSATLLSTPLYVRLKSGLAVGNYNTEIVSNVGGGATQNVTCSGFVLGGPTTYTWTGATDNSWIVASNWSPVRTTPALNDILQFNNGNTYTVINVPTQTIAQLLVSGGSKITLQAAAAATLTLAGTTGDDLSVTGTGSELNISGTNILAIFMNAGTNGLISSSMTLSGAAHAVKSTDANSLVFASGSIFKATTGFTGNAFGATALNSVKFQAGSTYIQDAGSNPFGAGAPTSVLTFEAGSLYKFTAASGGPSYSGRTYANFENDSPTSTQNNQGSSPMTCDNYTVTSGIVNWDFSGGMVIKGNISVASGATLTYGLATKVMNLTLSGTALQTITNAGTLTIGANATVVVNNPANISLGSDLSIYNLNFLNGKVNTGSNTLSLAATATVTGAGAGKYINGNQLWNIVAGAVTKTFDIGDAANYTPATIAFSSLTVGGTLVSHTTAGDHAAIASSGINPNKSVNRSWSFTASGISGYSYDATFNFQTSDLDAGASTALFIIKKYDGTSWSATTTGTLTSNSSQATGLTAFSDFQIGEVACTPVPVSVSIVPSANPVSAGTQVTFTATPVNGGPLPTYQWKVNGLDISGATNSIYTYLPVNNDQVVCVMTSNIECASGNPATSNTVTMTVTSVPAALSVSGTVANAQTECYNATQTITVAGTPSLFLVQNGGTATMIAGQNIIYLPGTMIESGAYLHGYIADGGPYCGGAMASMVTIKTGAEELQEKMVNMSSFRIYPNPTTGIFNLEFTQDKTDVNAKVEVYDLQGGKILSTTVSGERKHSLSIEGKPFGCYFIRVISNDKAETVKIIKQ
ncbi:MAG: choice-of-anchor V domain-containing protein [Bacteroidales bacterium]